jgi:hypothetical protein
VLALPGDLAAVRVASMSTGVYWSGGMFAGYLVLLVLIERVTR